MKYIYIYMIIKREGRERRREIIIIPGAANQFHSFSINVAISWVITKHTHQFLSLKTLQLPPWVKYSTVQYKLCTNG
jgi:hypothetical protein